MYSIRFMSSIKTRLIAQMLLFIALPFAVVIAFLFYTARNESENNQRELAETLYSQVAGTMTERIEFTQSMARSILANGDLIRFISQPYSARDDYEFYMTVIRRHITSVTSADYRSDIRIYTANTSIPMGAGVFYSLDDVINEPVFSAFAESNDLSAWYLGQDFDDGFYNPYLPPSNGHFIYLEKMYSPSLDFIGIIAFSISESLFFFGSGTYNESVISFGDARLVNMTGTVFEQHELEAICAENIGHHSRGNTHIYSRPTDFFPLKLMIIIPSDTSTVAQYVAIASMVLFVMFSIIMFTRSINSLTRRMNDCVNSMDASVSNDFNYRLPADTGDEMGQIAHRINLLLDKIQEQVKLTVIKETAEKEAQLVALQHQINPHFIYNTLELFSSKMKLMGNYSDSDSLVSFANIFRYNVNTVDTMVAVKDEIAQVQSYMRIQKLFYPNIDLEVSIPDEILSAKMPKFIFQPLIENSIMHGTKSKSDNLTIWIMAEADSEINAGYVRFCVINNGIGLCSEKIELLNASLKAAPADTIKTSAERSIGLCNINNRLRLQYGDDAHITIRREDGRTIVSFVVRLL